jgi:acetyl esterase/lipase
MFNKKFNLLKEATEYGFMPYMETYILDGKKRPIVVIFPGGGYGMVSEREAERIAMAYNAAGFHAAVVLNRTHIRFLYKMQLMQLPCLEKMQKNGI